MGVTALNGEGVSSGLQLLSGALLDHLERIAERSVDRMQELFASYADAPREALIAIALANIRNLLEAIRDPESDPGHAPDLFQAPVGTPQQLGITSDERLQGWRIALEMVREDGYAVAGELDLGTDVLLEFVEATIRWGDTWMRASAASHHEAEIRELGRLGAEQAALRRVATLVAQGPASERLFAVVAEQVGSVLHVPLVSVVRFELDGTATQCASSSNPGRLFRVGTRWSLDGTNVLADVRRTGRPARIDDHAGLTGEIAETVRGAGISSAVGIPIVVGGRLWGAIVVSSPEVEALPIDTESRLMDFSELVAVAIANANARAEVERLVREQAALRRVATLVAQGVPAETVFAAVAEEVGQLLGVDSAGIERFEAEANATVMGSWGKFGQAFPIGSRWKLEGETVGALVYRTGEAIRTDNYEHGSGAIAAAGRGVGLRSAVASPIFVNGRLWGVIAVASSGTEPMPPDAESRITQFTELVATAIANLQARSSLERLAQEQTGLQRLAEMVARVAPAEEVFARVAEEVVLVLAAEAALIHRFDEAGGATVVGSWATPENPYLVEQQQVGPFRLGTRSTLDGDSVTAQVYRTGRAVRFDDYERASGTIAANARRLSLTSAVGAPIVVNGQLWGAMVAATTRAEPLAADAASRIEQFTELVGTAIANVQARAELADSRARIVAAADEERRGVVRDLHDGAQQRLVHTIVTLRLARRALERGEPDSAGLVDQALQHAQTANEELRELAHGILPSVLTHGGLLAGVRALTSRVSIPVEIEVSVERLPATVEATVYFIVAEALTNVAKHSGAHRATVSVWHGTGGLQVEVSDDGVGGAQPRTGLVGLRDRVAVLEGGLQVHSPTGGGTRIAAFIPLR